MFSEFFKGRNRSNFIRQCQGDHVLGTVLIGLDEITKNLNEGIGKHYSEEEKNELTFNCLKEVEKTIQVEDKITAIRKKTVDYVSELAMYTVLVLKEPNSGKYVSGELSGHLIEIYEVDEEIRNFIENNNTGSNELEDIYSLLVTKMWILHFYATAYNYARCALKDNASDANLDWYRACYKSYLIYWEDYFRKELKLQSIFTEEKADLKLVCLSSWWSIVSKKPEDMRQDFENSYFNVFNEKPSFLNN